MENSLTLSSIAALFGSMVILALIPSVSVLTVSARSSAYGFTHGVYTTIGIVSGDVIFILLAIYGLSVFVDILGGYFYLLKYIGGTYLIWLGLGLWKSDSKSTGLKRDTDSTLLSSFLTGLLITLGDQKAILFYLGFLPAYIDLDTITAADTGTIIIIATVAIVGSKLVYAFMADRARTIFQDSRVGKGINIAAGCVMIGAGIVLFATA